MKLGNIRSRKADSTVIATVILVSVTVTLAFFVAYWIAGTTGNYLKYEKVGMQSGVCTWDSNATCWKIALRLENTGTARSTLMGAFINDVEVENYGQDSVAAGSTSTNMTTSTSLESGASVTINIYIDQGYATLSPRTVVNIKIHCAGGAEYIKPIELV